MNAIETFNLTKRFNGIKWLDGLSVCIESGKITSIIWPNWSGKSTLVNVLTWITDITSWHVILDKNKTLVKIKSVENLQHSITRTFQESRLFNQMTVLDNLIVTLTKRNFLKSFFENPNKKYSKKAEEILLRVNLFEKKDELANNLSYWQRKLLEIARIISMDTKIIFLDEPFAWLFPEIIKIIVSIIKKLKEEWKTIVLIEHNMDLIRQLSDKVIVLDGGKLLAEWLPWEVLSRKDVMEAYLGE
ncbi:MAG: hypothetical protein ACD_3C00123G0011 [uncultured bacterium (gcode 4)]|uniref:ABC transporter domain-containing protein n=1 Tax=uncultured bacterium (gcode 4) TaxID=1234023 RepID=K2GX45_9BACT|nr:MAG: hypothetical protein ACD_3C00123G0011 [uncultured bacterium (gcode 4)]